MALTYTPKVWDKIGESSVEYSYEEYGVEISSTDTITITYAPLTLVINEEDSTKTGTLSITKTGNTGIIYYSKDNGVTKEELSSNEIKVSQGEKVRLYRTLDRNLSSNDYFTINTSGCTFKAYGSVMSLIDGDNFSDSFEISYNYALYNLFANNSNITDFSGIVLQATELSDYCYCGMFSGCTGLTTAPKLEAETLANGCYKGMFSDCTSLETAPVLPATTLAHECYAYMFENCWSLTKAPDLPAGTLAVSCYNSMLKGCWSLSTAPALPATTLADYCYNNMFSGCTSLTTSPELPATTLANHCYDRMFNGCNKLTTAPTLPATTLFENCYLEMFAECSSLTTAPVVLPAQTLAKGCYLRMFYNCSSLTTAPALPATTLASECYLGMFGFCTNLTTAPALPAERLDTSCYSRMFERCTSLKTAPALRARTLAHQCYYFMFEMCTSLTTAPALPATELKDSCYKYMFAECTSLETAPVLPATTLARACYSEMFSGCTSLTSAPKLPATTLASECYSDMFFGCTSLTTAPELPATTLVEYCYFFMFYGCRNLNKITCLATNISATNCTMNWVDGVAATGTFTRAAIMTSWTTGVNGIPSGWTIEMPMPVGGTIFYIDNTASGTYRFFNAQGQEVSAPTVGTDCTGWTYIKNGGNGKDKYYISDITNKNYININYGKYNRYVVWSKAEDNLPTSSIESSSTYSSVVGTGKRNNNYIKNYQYNEKYYPYTFGLGTRISVWDIRDIANSNNANGCSDWYVPSIGELIQLRNNCRLTLQQWFDSFKYGSTKFVIIYSSSCRISDGVNDTNWTWWTYPPTSRDEVQYSSRGYYDDELSPGICCVLIRSF